VSSVFMGIQRMHPHIQSELRPHVVQLTEQLCLRFVQYDTMLSHKVQTNIADAEAYFKEHLQAGDYYSQNQEVLGLWHGAGAKRLGLSGPVRSEGFLKLCQNQHPTTGERLTQRHKTTRMENGKEIANRRVFFDFTFSPPKSVSMMCLLGDDKRILNSHDRAVSCALLELEFFAATRVHAGDRISDRLTNNFIAATFRHDTSRALDPHLHTHCVLFNATHDSVEDRWKAMDNFEMLRARKYVENVYYHELAKNLLEFGYEIENKARGDFGIKGVPQELCDRFSKRHQAIDEAIAELKESGSVINNEKGLREAVSLDKRARKIQGIQPHELKRLWNGQLSDAEKRTLTALKPEMAASRTEKPDRCERALRWAEQHVFDRHSVVLEHHLWRHALEHGRGENWTVADLKAESQQHNFIRDEDRPGRVTTHEMLRREYKIVEMAHDGISEFWPLANDFIPHGLADDQKLAVEQILNSRNFVTLFRGGAGTGKSFALRAVNQGLIEAGHSVVVLTPQRQQAIELSEAGFKATQTVSEFLARNEMPHKGVVLVDEAGQIGAKQMLELLELIQTKAGRVILSGDTRQHGAVEASDALRAIEKYSGIVPAELKEIRRQNPALGTTAGQQSWIKEYRTAIAEAQAGELAASFDRLDRLGAVIECRDQTRRLASHFCELTVENQSAVVVSQTWDEIHRLNENIRAELKSMGLLGKKDTTVATHQRRDLTPAQKRDRKFYGDDGVLIFQKRTGGIRRGGIGKLWDITDTHLLVQNDRRINAVSFDQLENFHVCRTQELALAAGDRLQLKGNGETVTGRKLANGELVTVKEIAPDGRIRLTDGRILEKHYREFVRGYAVTSYASQGKTVDYVLFSDSADKAATNAQQWYVTSSRGRKGIRIFTGNRSELRANIVRSGHRPLALELIGLQKRSRPKSKRTRRWLTLFRQRAHHFLLRRQSVVNQQSENKQHENANRSIRI